MGFPFLLPAPRFAKCMIREYRIPVSSFRRRRTPYRHFERKREIFFVRDRSGKVRTADNGKHRIPSDFILGAVFPQKVSRRFAFFAAL